MAKHWRNIRTADQCFFAWPDVETIEFMGNSNAKLQYGNPTPQEPVTRGGEEEEHAKHQGHIEVHLLTSTIVLRFNTLNRLCSRPYALAATIG